MHVYVQMYVDATRVLGTDNLSTQENVTFVGPTVASVSPLQIPLVSLSNGG